MSFESNDHASFLIKSHIVRIFSAVISFCCSIIIVFAIIRLPNGLSSPYRRIIVCVSIAEALQAISLAVGPYAVPRDEPNSFLAYGNVSTCNANGFLLNLAGFLKPIYIFGLTLYYLLRVKYKVSKKKFTRAVEWKLHVVVLSYGLVGNIYALLTKNLNATSEGSFCTFSESPSGCDSNPELYGQCIRGANSDKLKLAMVFSPFFICFIGMSVCLSKLSWYAFNDQTEVSSPGGSKSSPFCFLCKKKEKSIGGTEIAGSSLVVAPNVQRQYAKEMLLQSCLYATSYLFTYLFLAIAIVLSVLDAPRPLWHHLAISATWPLGGFINIFIYTRPKISIFRKRNPHLSWIEAFRSVILAGVEIPDEIPAPSRINTRNNLIQVPLRTSVNAQGTRSGSQETMKRESKSDPEVYNEEVHNEKVQIPSSFLNRTKLSFGGDPPQSQSGSDSEVVSDEERPNWSAACINLSEVTQQSNVKKYYV
jgi:hypothetical protein